MKTCSFWRDKTKNYQFYKDHRHDTEDYQTLKDEIEFLVRKGCLEQYIRPENNAQPHEEP